MKPEQFMKAILDHCMEGGSFRYLIYERMGLEMSDYGPMYEAGGMAFSNACPINLDPEVEPHISWAGVAIVKQIEEEFVLVEFGGEESRFDFWPGHHYTVGDPVLCIYLSAKGYGLKFALEPGRYYRVSDLPGERP